MTTIFDLPENLVEEEIFSRVPLTSLRAVRSTCKKWNISSKNWILGKATSAAARKNQFMGFMVMDHRVFLMEFNLQGIRDNQNFVEPCIKQVSVLDQIGMFNVFHYDGLLLCVVDDNSRVLIWNPYLGQTRWIQPRKCFEWRDLYVLGYDNNRNHKILRICDVCTGPRKYNLEFEIYSFSSDSWKLLDVSVDWEIKCRQRGVSLQGNAYFSAHKRTGHKRDAQYFLLCFNFTTECFGPCLPLPFHSCDAGNLVSLTCVGEDQIAVLYQIRETSEAIEIFVTDKIDPNSVSWRKFLKLVPGFVVHPHFGSFFIDEEKKVAVVFDLDLDEGTDYQTAHIIGQDGYFKSIDIAEAPDRRKPCGFRYFSLTFCLPIVCSSYVPSLVQLQFNQPGK